MDPKQKFYNKRGELLVKNLRSRHYEAYYCETKEEALAKALELIPKGASVGWGGAMSAKQIGLLDAVNHGHYHAIDRDKAPNPEARKQAMKDCLLTDVFITGANALSMDGQMVNIDGNGNRVAAIVYGPENILVIAGMNKVMDTLEAAVMSAGCEPVYLGLAGDTTEGIASRMVQGWEICDLVISTGGVSVGDYDLTPDAMEMAGATLMIQRLTMKPGMACAFGAREGKLICALSGNPSSSLTTFYAVVLPVLRKLAGWQDPIPQEIDMVIPSGFGKKSRETRFLRGTLDLSGGCVKLITPKEQGNVVLSSTIGCNAMAIVPAGTDKVEPGTVLKGFVL